MCKFMVTNAERFQLYNKIEKRIRDCFKQRVNTAAKFAHLTFIR